MKWRCVTGINNRPAEDHLVRDRRWAVGIGAAYPVSAILNIAIGELARRTWRAGSPKEDFTVRLQHPKAHPISGDEAAAAAQTLPTALPALNDVDRALALQRDLVADQGDPDH